jgi:hypothetical protein
MADDINLTNRLSQWRTPTQPTVPPPARVQPRERRLRRDGFACFAYGLFAFFMVAQFLIMEWLAAG